MWASTSSGRMNIAKSWRAGSAQAVADQSPAAADVQDPQPVGLEPERPGEDAAHVGEAGGVEAAPEDVQEPVLVPPGVAEAVVHPVVDWQDCSLGPWATGPNLADRRASV